MEDPSSPSASKVGIDTGKVELNIDDDVELDLTLQKDPHEAEKRSYDYDNLHEDTKASVDKKDGGDDKIDEEDDIKEDEDEKAVEIPLVNDSVKIDVGTEGDDAPTLPIRKKKSQEAVDAKQEKDGLGFVSPIKKIEDASKKSTSIGAYIVSVICIVYSTIGWVFCFGGVPFMSIVMIIIGSIYIDSCNIQPNIPVYLIVSGIFGTIQHCMTVFMKYVPKDVEGGLKVYRAYCGVVDGLIQVFSLIWMVIGCVWVYSVYDKVEYKHEYMREYCHKTVYLFAFWILNFSFFVLLLIISLVLCTMMCFVKSSKS